MAKNLPELTSNVYPFIEQSIANQEASIQAIKAMFSEMKNIKESVSEQHAEIKILAQQIQDENRLLPAEIDELYEAVRKKSIGIVKDTANLEGDEFKREVGKIRRFIWSKLKKKFGVSKYIHLPRKDFEEALHFVITFSVLDHI